MRRLAGLLAVVLLAACSGGAPGGDVTDVDDRSTTSSSTTTEPDSADESSTTTRRSTTSMAPRIPPAEADDAPCSTTSSSTSYDPESGRYAVQLVAFDAGDGLATFDVIQFLTGDEAASAYQSDNPDAGDGGPPNDYYTRNTNQKTYEASVAAGARYRLLDTESGLPELHAGTAAELEDHLEPRAYTFWLDLDAGSIVRVCQQWVP